MDKTAIIDPRTVFPRLCPGGVILLKGKPAKHRRLLGFRDVPTYRAISRDVFRSARRAEGQADDYLREGNPAGRPKAYSRAEVPAGWYGPETGAPA